MSNIKNKSKNSLQIEGFEVVAVNDPEMRPFLNVFIVDGKNIQQQKLGKAFGIIQIDEHSEDSAYLPNMLTQIFKKEYYRNKNKACGYCFEMALHKINLSLTELAQHEIVKWIGNLNAVIGVICENEIHFTQIGAGRLLFLKNKKIIKLGLESKKSEQYHPMKTFSSISEGKVKKGDKLILTIEETFKTLKDQEIERHYKTFNSNEFDNIITSTLKNEASNTGMLVINIAEKEENILENSPDSDPNANENLNFFGKNNENKKEEKPKPKEENKTSEEFLTKRTVQNNDDSNKSPFENEPEIFLKEKDAEDLPDEINSKINFLKSFSEKINQIFEKYNKENLIKKISFNKVNLKSWKNNIENKFKKNKMASLKNSLLSFTKKTFTKIDLNSIKNSLKNKALRLWAFSKKINLSKPDISKIEDSKPVLSAEEKYSKKYSFNKFVLKTKIFLKELLQKVNLGKIKKNKKKYLIIFIIILAILLIWIFAKTRKVDHGVFEIKEISEKSQTKKNKLSDIGSLKNLVNLEKKIKDTTFFKNNLFLLTEEGSLIKYSTRDNKKTEILLPENFTSPLRLSSIESLQLILIIGSKKVLSYSPTTNNFSENVISLPNGFDGIGVGTYLTYLYLIDKSTDQIYRYHRATGGFGSSKEWLKENVALNQASSLDVSDSIYIGFNDGKIKKYFQGKAIKEFDLEDGFIPNEIRVKINKDEIFALDSKQGKIIKLTEENSSKNLFQDENFKESKSFSVDFENKKVFLITDKNELLVFNYQ